MKKKIVLLLSLILFIVNVMPLAACSTEEEELVLRISNCEDYICGPDEEEEEEPSGEAEEADESTTDEEEDEEVVTQYMYDEFADWYSKKTGKKVRVEYSTFGTPEILYNNMKINPGSYDIVCPSDYMIQKMIAEDMLQPFTNPEKDMPNYTEYVSPFIKELFDEQRTTPNGKRYTWSEYSVPYMWGTMGFVYNPEYVTEEEVSTWEVVLNDKFNNKTTIKDSIRDTYFLGLALANITELRAKNEAFLSGALTKTDYSAYLAEVFNRTDEETVTKVEGLLKQAKERAYALEVDSGKDDMITGKIYLNFAWSGDAVYAMDQAEEPEDSPVYLNYAVPSEGSNIWFDGWVMPKGANEELATAFLDYISEPANACRNMDFIGYTSAIGGEEVFERIKTSDYCVPESTPNAKAIDLTYFFGEINGERAIVYIDEENSGRQLECQYPPKDVTSRCAMMQYFDDEANERINSMWVRVKADNITMHVIIIGVSVLLIAGLLVAYKLITSVFPERKPPKGYKRVA